MDFNGLITLMRHVVSIHSNTAVIIGMLSLPIKKWKNHLLMAKVWSKFTNATGKNSNLSCLTLVSLRGLSFLLDLFTGVTVKIFL